MKLKLEVANFICRFGNKAVMLDYFEEIIAPAFQQSHERTYRDTRYFFIDTSLVLLAPEDPATLALVGRFVMDTSYEREQIFEKQSRKITKSPLKIPTSPSSIFALMLLGHRLLFVREQRDSPAFGSFQTTTERFIRIEYNSWVRREAVAARQRTGKRVTLASISEQVPIPNVEVVPIYNDESFDKFVDRFSIIKSSRFDVLQTNSEIDNTNYILSRLRDSGKELESAKTQLTFRNSAGLNKRHLKDVVRETGQGNTHVQLMGTDSRGNDLTGDNKNFNVRRPMVGIADNPVDAGIQCRNEFEKMQKEGVINVPKSDKNDEAKVAEIAKSASLIRIDPSEKVIVRARVDAPLQSRNGARS